MADHSRPSGGLGGLWGLDATGSQPGEAATLAAGPAGPLEGRGVRRHFGVSVWTCLRVCLAATDGGGGGGGGGPLTERPSPSGGRPPTAHQTKRARRGGTERAPPPPPPHSQTRCCTRHGRRQTDSPSPPAENRADRRADAARNTDGARVSVSPHVRTDAPNQRRPQAHTRLVRTAASGERASALSSRG